MAVIALDRDLSPTAKAAFLGFCVFPWLADCSPWRYLCRILVPNHLAVMTGTTLSSSQLDPRRRRILIRAWRRGTREMDLMIGRFADDRLVDMPESDLAMFEALIDCQDTDLFEWVTGAKPVPSEQDTAVFRQLREFSLTQPLTR